MLWVSKCQVKVSEDKTISGNDGWKLSGDKMHFLTTKLLTASNNFKNKLGEKMIPTYRNITSYKISVDFL